MDMDSILGYIKKVIGGIDENNDYFDPDLIMFINAAFTTLCQLGIGPETPFKIEDDSAEWSDFDYQDLEAVKEWIYIKVRLIFDPPQNSSITSALESRKAELEWRMNVMAEEIKDGK